MPSVSLRHHWLRSFFLWMLTNFMRRDPVVPSLSSIIEPVSGPSDSRFLNKDWRLHESSITVIPRQFDPHDPKTARSCSHAVAWPANTAGGLWLSSRHVECCCHHLRARDRHRPFPGDSIRVQGYVAFTLWLLDPL